jgi:hypothetical protein
MTPLQRGAYLLWLAGGRIQPPSHRCYPILWLFGLERRVLSDRLDIAICIGEAFRLLPLIRWESLRQGLIKFITWMAAKAWLPEEQLMAFCRSLPTVPTEILSMLLRPYAEAKLPLPSTVAFTVMRASSLAEGEETKRSIPHDDDFIAQFAPKYKSKCAGGLVLPRPTSSLFMAYVPTNPTLSGDKNIAGGVLELPDFFKDATNFAPLVAVWKEFLKNIAPSSHPEPSRAAEELEKLGDRPDWDSFVRRLLSLPDPEDPSETVEVTSPLTTSLTAVADLVRIERPGGSQIEQEDQGEKNKQKPSASDRKKIADTARVEGFLILPDLGIAGKEYHWDDPIVLAPFPSGLRPSQDYNAAALLLEYACALTGFSGPEGTDKVKTLAGRLDDYFPLTSDDHVRLDALSSIFSAASSTASSGNDSDNIGECLQFWLQREQRVTVRDFLAYFLAPEQNTQEGRRGSIAAVCKSLDIERPSSMDVTPMSPEARLELGAQVSKILMPLFKD